MNLDQKVLLDYVIANQITLIQQIDSRIICMYIPELQLECLIDFDFQILQTNDNYHNILNLNYYDDST